MKLLSGIVGGFLLGVLVYFVGAFGMIGRIGQIGASGLATWVITA